MNQLDTQAFLLLNGLHSPWLDTLMALITNKFTWIPLYVLIIASMIKTHKKEAVPMLVMILVCILFSDQICSSILKPWVARLRPCHQPSLDGLVHLVGGCGGQYGFCSSHAANSFTLAASLWYLFGQQHRWVALFFPWAIIVSYSRIYVGVHYPLDILAGALVGLVVAKINFECYLYYLKNRKAAN
ncbi:phosphatase PAP2 family protein [Flectobacillus major]|uniref:phosphatase PAP2 family protein n=1 Tax=Flectobacillus major TaxID=103 RepID=UPI000420C62E|nr:phosphatase PAP2 family protein [Flectobacillus major]